MTLGAAVSGGSVDLGANNDTLRLANGTNSVSVTNTETVLGGTGGDTITLTGSNNTLVDGGAGINFIKGNAGANEYVLDQNGTGDYSKIMNFGAGSGDMIALDTTGDGTRGINAYDIGGAALTSADLTSVADNAALLTTTLSNNGKGGFAYEVDNGHLYYSNTGSFAGGGTLIGIITTDGTAAWTFDSTKFTQV